MKSKNTKRDWENLGGGEHRHDSASHLCLIRNCGKGNWRYWVIADISGAAVKSGRATTMVEAKAICERTFAGDAGVLEDEQRKQGDASERQAVLDALYAAACVIRYNSALASTIEQRDPKAFWQLRSAVNLAKKFSSR